MSLFPSLALTSVPTEVVVVQKRHQSQGFRSYHEIWELLSENGNIGSHCSQAKNCRANWTAR